MKLFGHPDSGHALKVKFYLDYLNIPHDYQYVDIFAPASSRSEEFLTASRFAEVPTLIDDGKNFTQSNAILMYLADKFQQFTNDKERQTCLEWLMWEVNKIGMCVPHLRGHDKLSQQQPHFLLTQGAYDWLFARYQHDVKVLEDQLSDKPFILGQKVSPADFSLSAYLLYADEINITVPDNVNKWLERLKQLNGWQSPYLMLKGLETVT